MVWLITENSVLPFFYAELDLSNRYPASAVKSFQTMQWTSSIKGQRFSSSTNEIPSQSMKQSILDPAMWVSFHPHVRWVTKISPKHPTGLFTPIDDVEFCSIMHIGLLWCQSYMHQVQQPCSQILIEWYGPDRSRLLSRWYPKFRISYALNSVSLLVPAENRAVSKMEHVTQFDITRITHPEATGQFATSKDLRVLI